MAAKKKGSGLSFGPVSTITAFLVTLVPIIVGFSLTGNAVSVPAIGGTGNVLLGWLLVLAGLFSVYTFFTQRK